MAEGWEPAKMECMIPIYICVCIMCNYSYVFLQIYTSYIQYIYIYRHFTLMFGMHRKNINLLTVGNAG